MIFIHSCTTKTIQSHDLKILSATTKVGNKLFLAWSWELPCTQNCSVINIASVYRKCVKKNVLLCVVVHGAKGTAFPAQPLFKCTLKYLVFLLQKHPFLFSVQKVHTLLVIMASEVCNIKVSTHLDGRMTPAFELPPKLCQTFMPANLNKERRKET